MARRRNPLYGAPLDQGDLDAIMADALRELPGRPAGGECSGCGLNADSVLWLIRTAELAQKLECALAPLLADQGECRELPSGDCWHGPGIEHCWVGLARAAVDSYWKHMPEVAK